MAINTELPIKTVLVDGQEIPIVAGSPKFAELVDGTITSLETSDLADVTTIRDGAFEGLTSLTSVAIPSNVTTIGASAFSGCSGITTLTLAEGVTTIGASAFSGISASEINIPSTLTSVGENAFANNTVLSEITIPDTLTSLSAGMFSGCTNLINVTMEATTPPSVTDTTFPDSVTAIYVIYGAYDDYVASWTAYADKIVRLPAIPSTITITVNNYLGEMVSGASVTISGNGHTYTGTTDSVGVFTQGDLQPATYTISVADIDGFKTPETQEVVVGEDSQNSVTVTYLEKPAVSTVFGENTPEQISAVSAEISANNMTSEQVASTYGWNIGDTISYQLSTGETVEMRITGYNHDDKSDGTGKAGITLEMVNCLATKYQMHPSSGLTNGFSTSNMYTTTLPMLKSLLPQEWQDTIKMVDKKAGAYGGSEIETFSCELFLLSEIEVFGSAYYAILGEEEGSRYQYYETNSSNSAWTKRIDLDGDGVPEDTRQWFLRSKKDSVNYACVGYSGGRDYNHQLNTSGISFAFCI